MCLALSAQEKGKKGPSPFENPKNLKILKAEGLQPLMRAYNASLGQECVFCHVMGIFPSDDNPKKGVTLMMISMTQEINAKFPDGKMHVTCFTCHNGSNQPKTDRLRSAHGFNPASVLGCWKSLWTAPSRSRLGNGLVERMAILSRACQVRGIGVAPRLLR
jgi:hypothetical protein